MRGPDPVWLPDRQMDVLLTLATRAGQLVSKEALAETVWRDVAVTDNSIVQAVSGLRQALGEATGGPVYIQTHVRRGYRFAAPVEQVAEVSTGASLDALLQGYRAFVDGRAALETLDRPGVARARAAFEEALRVEPGFAAAHIGLAHAFLLAFEATRVDAAPDGYLLSRANQHAREGCLLHPWSGDAWSILALVRHRSGEWREALAAARKATTLEPDDWRHSIRLAVVSWGEERLRAARRAYDLCPGLALGHWFAAGVFVARQRLDRALEELREGCAIQDAQQAAQTAVIVTLTDDGMQAAPVAPIAADSGASRFPAVGLHWLRGLVLAEFGDEEAALEAFAQELTFEDAAHIYAREAAANSWYASGAIYLRQGRTDEANAAFQQALARVPTHAIAAACLGRTRSVPVAAPPTDQGLEAVLSQAAALTLSGKTEAAGALVHCALTQAMPLSAGWVLPVDPVLRPLSRQAAWGPVLSELRARAL